MSTNEIKRPEDLVQHVTGIMKSAADPEFANRFVELLQQIASVNVADFGVREGEDLTIEVPLVFFARSIAGGGDGHLKLASIGGEHCVMTEEEKQHFTKNRLHMLVHKERNRGDWLETEVGRLETALEESGYYDHEDK